MSLRLMLCSLLLSAAVPVMGAEPENTVPFQQDRPLNKEVLNRLDQLQANTAVLLGQADVYGEFNEIARQFQLDKTGPRGRDFTIKMVWAPERQRALFCGANHAVPHRLNDVWEFDLAAFCWVMLYAPDNPRDYLGLGKDDSDVEYKEGVFITNRGGPAIIAHTWWGMTYDPDQRALYFMNTWVTDQKKAAEKLGGDPGELDAGPPLWSFTPQTGQWKRHIAEKPYPRPIFGGLLEYVPELKGSVWHANNWQMRSSWLYEPESNTWKDLQSNGNAKEFEAHAAEPEQVGYYDPQRKLLIMHRHKATSHYNVKANAWTKVIDAPKDSVDVPYGHDAWSPMYHDPVSGHGLLVELKTNSLWAYDPDKIAWTKLQPSGDPMPEGNKRLAYFDPGKRVFVVIQDRNVWAYRYR